MNSVCAYLKFDPELNIYATESKDMFHVKEVNFILNFSLKNNIVLEDIFVHIALIYFTISVTLLFNIVSRFSCCK
jgi:hypothetical protein